MVGVARIERATLCLKGRCSTTELHTLVATARHFAFFEKQKNTTVWALLLSISNAILNPYLAFEIVNKRLMYYTDFLGFFKALRI